VTNEEAADALKRLIYPTHAPYHNEVIRLAIAALRTPPATGAAMREAFECLRVAAERVVLDYYNPPHGDWPMEPSIEFLRTTLGSAAALPAPEVPEAVRAWAHCHDSYSSTRRTWEADTDMRDWIMKEYGL